MYNPEKQRRLESTVWAFLAIIIALLVFVGCLCYCCMRKKINSDAEKTHSDEQALAQTDRHTENDGGSEPNLGLGQNLTEQENEQVLEFAAMEAEIEVSPSKRVT